MAGNQGDDVFDMIARQNHSSGLHVRFENPLNEQEMNMTNLTTAHNHLDTKHSSMIMRNKSRKINRRQMTITAVKNDVEKLMSYCKNHIKKTESFHVNNEQENGKGKPRTTFHSCWNALINLLSSLLCIPCLLLTMCIERSRCCKKTSENVESHNSEKEEAIMQDYDYFWDPMDIDGETEHKRYLSVLKPVLMDWAQTKNPVSWAKIERELEDICTNDYLQKLQVWQDLYDKDDYGTKSIMTKLGLKMIQIAYSNGCDNVIQLLIQSLVADLGQFQTGLYKGVSPLHLAIVNQSYASIRSILSDDKAYERLHLRADDTPIQSIFTAVELPLNLAVWMGDPRIVELVIQKGAEMCATDQDGNNPMHIVALLGAENPDKAVCMLELLLDLVDLWLEETTSCKALLDLSLKKGRLVALHMLFKVQNKKGFTPLRLATKSNCMILVQHILNIEKLYRFPLYKLGPKSESLYDYSEIDPLLSINEETPSVLEMLAYEETDFGINMFDLPQIKMLMEMKRRKMRVIFLVVGLFHVFFMIAYNVSCYKWLFPLLYEKDHNSTWVSHDERFDIQMVDIGILTIAILYMLVFLLSMACNFQIAKRLNLSILTSTGLMSSLQLQTTGLFSASLFMYLTLKAVGHEEEIFALATSMLFGWIHCVLFTRVFKATGFFALMMNRVLFADVFRFLSIIGIMVLSYTMMTSALLMSDHSLVNSVENTTLSITPIDVMFDFFQLAVGIADFSTLQKSSYRIICGAIYITFLVMANILLFNLLIASMSNRYALISNNGDLLCAKIDCADIILIEWMMPNTLKKQAQQIYEHKIVRVKISEHYYLENHVHLLRAQDMQTVPNLARQQCTRRFSTVH